VPQARLQRGLVLPVAQQVRREGMTDDDLARIRQHVNQERVLGDERFQRMVEKTLGRPVACRPRGRPRSTSEI